MIYACQRCGSKTLAHDADAGEWRCLNGHRVDGVPTPARLRRELAAEAERRRVQHREARAQFARDRLVFDARHDRTPS